MRDDEALTGAARRHFGSWNAALRAAGYDPATIRYPAVDKHPPGYWSPERVIDELRAHVAAGHGLAAHLMDQLEPGLVPTAQRLFGSWEAAVHAAGYDYDAVRLTKVWTDAAIVERLQAAARQGADLSDQTVQALATDLYAAARQHFGSWPAALAAAGVEPAAARRTTRWDADRLRRLAQRLAAAGVPPAPVFAALDLESTVLDHYPSFAALWEAAGLHLPPPPRVRAHIRPYRQARHWSLQDTGRRLGVSHRAVSLWELGQVVPRLGHALALAQVLGVSVETLWTLDPTADPPPAPDDRPSSRPLSG